jgi:hypothetical protein
VARKRKPLRRPTLFASGFCGATAALSATMAQKPNHPSQVQKPADLPAETLKAIQEAVFLFEGEPVIMLPVVDFIHSKFEGAARSAFFKNRNTLVEGEDFIVASIIDFEGLVQRLNFKRWSLNNRGFRGKVTLLRQEGYLVVTADFSGDFHALIRKAIIEKFCSLKSDAPGNVDGYRVVFAYQSVPIRISEDGLISANDMYKAMKSPSNKESWRFAETEIAQTLSSPKGVILGKSEVLRSTSGRHGGTWMHPKVALAYALYLGVEFYSFVFDALQRAQEDRDKPASTHAPEPSSQPTPALAASLFDREELRAILAEEVGQAIQQEVAASRQEANASRESLTKIILSARDSVSGDLLVVRESLGEAIQLTRGEIAAAQEKLTRDMAAQFTKAEYVHSKQNITLFLNLQSIVYRNLQELSKNFQGNEKRVFDAIAESFRREFREFELRHFAPQSQPAAALDPKAIEEEKRRFLPLIIAWRTRFGETHRRAREIAALPEGSLVEGETLRGKTLRLTHWLAKMANQSFSLSAHQSVWLRLEWNPQGLGPKIYWLEIAGSETV